MRLALGRQLRNRSEHLRQDAAEGRMTPVEIEYAERLLALTGSQETLARGFDGALDAGHAHSPSEAHAQLALHRRGRPPSAHAKCLEHLVNLIAGRAEHRPQRRRYGFDEHARLEQLLALIGR